MSTARRNARRWIILSSAAATALAGVVNPVLMRNATGATNLWTNGDGTNSWNDPLNWGSGAVPAPTDALFFQDNGTANPILENSLDNSFSAQTLSFDTPDIFNIDANSVSGGLTTTQTLTLNGGTNANGGTDLISLSAGTTGTISMGATAGVGTLGIVLGTSGNINIANAAGTLVMGPNSVISGAFNLSQSGPGTLTLAGANTFGGAGNSFTLNSGTLNINSATALGNAANTFVINGGTVGTTAGPITTSNYAQTWSGDFTFGAGTLNLGTGAVSLTAGATRTITANGLTTVGGVISGAGSSIAIASGSTGQLTLTGNNTYTGGTKISGGTLAAAVSTGSSAVGTGAITLAGGIFQLSPTASTATNGLSERIFGTTGLGDTTSVNYSGTATSATTVANLASTTTVNGITTNGAAQFLGKLKITAGGSYTFYTNSDDGSRIFIDGALLVNDDGAHGLTDAHASVTLSAGLHDIRVDYIQGGGGLGETLSWSSTGLDAPAAETAIPTTALFLAESSATGGASNAVVVGSGLGDAVNVASSSTIALAGSNFTQAQVGALSFNTGTTLTVTGPAGKALRAAGAISLNSGATGTTTINNSADVYLDGVLSDGGNATTLTKLGTARLIFDQTSAANTLGSGSVIDVEAGTATLIGSTATGFANDPIGAAKLQLNGGNVVLDTKAGGPTYTNVINVLQSGTIQDIANAVTTTISGNTLNIGGGITLTLDAIGGGTDAGATLLIAEPVTGSGNFIINSTTFNSNTVPKGIVQFTGNLSGFSGNIQVVNGNLEQLSTTTGVINRNVELSGGTLTYLFDGDGTGAASGAANIFAPGDSVSVDTANSTITIGRLGTTFAPFYTTAANKTAQVTTLSIGAQTLTVNNNNGYGLVVTGGTTFTAAPTFSVATATGSNVVPGLTLSGAVSGGFGFTKAGAGTLLLTNAGNNFGTGNTFDITAGILAASNDGALGDSSNIVKLDANAATAVGLRATGTFATSRTFQFGQLLNAMEVTAGNSLTLNGAFTGTTATSQLDKNDNGTLILNAANPGTWSGSITAAGAAAQVLTGGVLVNAGAVQITNGSALGASTNIIAVAAAQGAAVQLAGGVNVGNPLDLNITTIAGANGGINGAGQLDSVSGNNTWSGAISENLDSSVGAEALATLNITGGVNQNVHRLAFNGAGAINVSGAGMTAVNAIDKNGSGITTITTSVAAPSTNGVNVNAGVLNFQGAGVIAAGTKTIAINPGGTLTVDDSQAAPVAHLGGMPMAFTGGNFNYIGNNSATSAETVGAPTFSRGYSVITVTAGSGQQANLTFSANSNSPGNAQNNGTAPTGATILFRGTNLGTAAGAGVATIKDSGTTGFTFNGQTGVTGSTNKGILPWALVDTSATGNGVSFATGDAAAAAAGTTAILRPLNTSTEMVTNAFTANTNVLLTAATPFTATANINSLTLNSGGGTTLSPLQFLTLSSGGILAKTGNTGITGGILSDPAANSPLTVWALDSFTIGSLLSGGNGNNPGLIKAGAGTLTLATPISSIYAGLSANTFNAQTDINQGTILLSGGRNTLAGNTFLEIGPGGTLDLNGSSQYVSGLFTDGAVAGAGGTIQSSTAQGTLVVNSDNTGRNWAGTVTGNVYFNRTGQNTLSVFSPQTNTAGTLINGGTVDLKDLGSMLTTPTIDINYATLIADNTGSTDSPDRINNAAAITLRGGIFQESGRAQTASSETIGAVSVAQGQGTIAATAGGTGVNSNDLTLASIANSNDATINFNGSGLGAIGSNARIFIGNINGTSTATVGSGLTNNIIGAWAIGGASGNSGNREWASYTPGLGVGALNQTGFAGYSTDTLANAVAADNIRITATPAALTADTVANTLNVNYAANTTVDLGAHKLTLAAGGLMLATGTSTTVLTIQNGTLSAGTTSSPTDLYVYFEPIGGTARTGLINAVIANNPSGGAVRLVYTASDSTASGNFVTLGGTNTYSGGTVINNGGLVLGATGTLPGGGLTINGNSSFTQTPGGVLTSQAVTINGSGFLTLGANDTLTGLTFNDNGGGATAPTVNTFTAGVAVSNTTLTIGAGGILATGSNVGSTSIIQGRLDLGASPNTIEADPILVNGIDVAQLQANLALQGVVGSAGGITKTGTGVLQLNAQDVFTGAITVSAGTLQFGLGGTSGATANPTLNGTAANFEAGSRFSDVNLASGTRLNINNVDVTIGSLTGAGTVTNASVNGGATLRTLNVGFDNTSTTFSGSIARFSDALAGDILLNKIGTGVMTMTGVSTDTATLQVSQGGVTFNGGGVGAFGTYNLLPTGTLILDNNSAGNQNSRLGQSPTTGTLTLGGGELQVIGNSAAATTESIGTLGYGATDGMSTITLAANAAQSLTFDWGAGGLNYTNGSAALFRGLSTTVAPGNANLIRFAGTAIVALNVSGGQGAFGTVALPTVTEAVRPDLLGDASATGSGTGFITQDSSTGLLHPLGAAELATTLTSAATTNFGLSAVANITAATAANTLTLSAGGGVNDVNPAAFGRYDATGGPLALTLTTGGVLVQNGASVINVGNVVTANSPLFVWTTGNSTTLSLTGSMISAQALSKNGTGSLTLNSQQFNTGQHIAVNGGTLILNGGTNTLGVSPTATTQGQLTLSSGTLVDLNGNSQIVGTLTSPNPYANTGGTVTNSAGGAPVNLTTITNSVQTFGGVIAGNLNFFKSGNNPLTLTSPNTFTGSTTIRANTLSLRDQGTLSNTTSVTVDYAALNIDQTGLNPIGNLNPTRIPATVPISLVGSTLIFTGGGSIDSSATFNTVNAVSGHDSFSVPAPTNVGATSTLTIGNLVLGSPDTTINFLGGGNNGNFFNTAPGINNSELFINTINGSAITLTNKVLGGWAVTNNGEFATYVTSATPGSGGVNWGVVTMNGPATIAQTQYDSNTTTFPATNATSNVRLTATATIALPAGGASYNVLAVRAATPSITFAAATDVLNLTTGGLALTNGGTTLGAVGSGFLTAGNTQSTGTAPLYIYSNGNTNTVAATIENNPAGAIVRTVLVPIQNQLNISGINTYTGGTVINAAGGGVTLTGATPTAAQISAGQAEIPKGGLTINSATLTMNTNAGQIDPTNAVTLNGNGALTLVGSNTLASLTFNDAGGSATPTVATATLLTLTAANAITSQNDFISTIPTISGTALALSSVAPTINASGMAPTDLIISAPITSTNGNLNINPTGTGMVDLTGQSTFGNGVTLSNGTLMFGASSTGTTSGPVGVPGFSTLTLGNNTAIMSDTAIRTIANNVTVNGNFTFGALNQSSSPVAVNGVILSGPVTFSSGAHTIFVNSQLNTSTISGVLGGGTNFTKDGPGILVLSNAANTYGGTTTVNGGVLTGGVVNALPAGSDLTLNPGGVFNVNGFNQTVASLAGGGLLTDSGAAAVFTMGTDNASTTFTGQMASATAGNLTVIKAGTGTFTIASAQSFTGTTNVNGGTYTFTPAGSLAGTLSVNSGGTLAALAGNTITLGNLAFTNNSNATFPLSGPSATPLFNATGSLTAAGQDKITVTGLSGPGTYSLIGYAGTQLTGAQFAGLIPNASSPGNYVVLKNDPQKVDLVVEGQGSTNKWTGSGGASWDTTTASWTSSPYQNGQQVTFDDTGSNTNITSTGTITPQTITFNNSALNYVIANNIAGNLAGGITKNGTGIAQLTGVNTGAGPVSVNAGTLRISATTAGNALGTGAVTLAGGTLQIDPTASIASNGLTGRTFNTVAGGDDTSLFNYAGTASDTRTYFSTGTATVGNGGANVAFYTGGPLTNFSVQFTGKINIPNTGPYNFFTSSDDGSRVFIDGQLLAVNDGGKGNTEVGGAIQLTAGLHDIRIDYNQGTGNDIETLSWQGPGIVKAVVPAANLFIAETSANTGASDLVALGNNVSVTSSSTINSTGSNNVGVLLGGLSSSNGTTLTVAGASGKLVRFTGTSVTGTATYSTTPDLALGNLNDNGIPATIIKQGTGRLILDGDALGAGSTLVAGTLIDSRSGDVVVQGLGSGSNPIGAAKLQINGGNLALDTKGGSFALDNPVNVAQSGLLKVLPDAATITLGSTPTNGLALNANNLTIDVYGGARGSAQGTLTAAGATLQVNGIISGSGALTVQSSQFNAEQLPVPGALTLTAANTLTGPIVVNGSAFTGPAVAGVNSPQNVVPLTLTLNGNGSVLSASSVGLNTARLTIDDSGTNLANRIADAQDVVLNSSTLNFIGNTTAVSNETFNNLNVNAGFNTVTMSNTFATGATSLTANGTILRSNSNNGTVAFQGTALGGAATAADQFKVTTSPTLVGGAGAAGTTTISVLPYAVASNANGLPQVWMLATNGANGIRPLAATEYATSAASANNTDNVRDSAPTGTITVTGKTVNSYVLDDSTGVVTTAGSLAATLNGTLQITSGALLFTNSAFTGATNNVVQGLSINGGTSGALSFGAEAVITVMDTTGATLGAALPISGSAGLTVSGNGPLIIASTGNTLTGPITINGTTLSIAGDTSLGAATNPIQFGGGILKFNAAAITLASTRTVTLLPGTFGTFDTSANSGTVAGPVVGSGSLVKINGNTLTLSSPSYTGLTYVYGGTLVTNSVPQGNIIDNAATTFNQLANGSYGGVISGIGSFAVTGGSGVTLTTNNTFAGGTSIQNGTIVDALDNALPLGGTVSLGSNGAAGNLDLTNANQTVGPLSIVSASATPSTVTIGSGKTLSVLGNVLIGSNNSATDVTNATFTGGGTMTITNSGGSVQFGGATGATNGDQVTADFTGLASLTANLGSTGIFRVGDVNSATATDTGTVLLPPTTTIVAGTFDVGSDAGGNFNQTVKLGSGVTTLDANTINIGAVTGRALGFLQFNSGSGSVVIRGADGVSPAAVNLVNGATGTGAAVGGTLDVTGHNADILISTLTMSARSAGNTGAGNATSVFSFDTGTLNIGTAILSSTSGTTDFNGTSTATLNVNGGTAVIGSIALAANSATGTGTPGSSNGIVNFNGGNVTLGGDITKTGATGGGGAVATVNLAGANLNMQGHKIGSLAQPIDVATFAGGTLQNLGEFNGGLANGAAATFTKTSTATLTLAGVNTYTGPTTINQGTLVNGSATGLPSGTVLTVGQTGAGNTATFDMGGFNVLLNGLASAGTTPANDTVTNNGAGSGTNTLTVNNDAATSNADFTYNGLITDGATAHVSLIKNGSRLLALGGANTYTGPTNINNGILLANTSIPSASATGSGAVTVNNGGTLAGGSSAAPGFILSSSTNTAVTVTSGGTISAGNGVTTTSTPGLLVTSGGTAPTTYSHVWAGNGNYAWKVNGSATTGSTPQQVSNGGATVGTTDTAGGANWDMLSVQTLNVTATSTTPFNINVVPLTSSTGFSPTGVYTWTIADVTGANGIYLNGSNSAATLQGATSSPFGALLAALNLNAAQLSSQYGANGSGFSLGVTSDGAAGEDIVINYNAAPEPTSLMLLGLGAGGLLLRRRRRQTV